MNLIFRGHLLRNWISNYCSGCVARNILRHRLIFCLHLLLIHAVRGLSKEVIYNYRFTIVHLRILLVLRWRILFLLLVFSILIKRDLKFNLFHWLNWISIYLEIIIWISWQFFFLIFILRINVLFNGFFSRKRLDL